MISFAHGFYTFKCVSGEPCYTLHENSVEFLISRVPHHTLEFITLVYGRSRDTLVGINFNKAHGVIFSDVIVVMLHLRKERV